MIDIMSDVLRANVLLSHIEDGAPKAIMRAMNRTIDGVKTDIVNQVKNTYDIKPGKVRKVIKAVHSRTENLSARVVAKGSKIPLIQFNVTPNRPGTVLRASVKRSGGKPIPDAFIASANGHIGVFERVGKDRLPIQELLGPAVPQMINEPTIQQNIMAGAEDRFTDRMNHEIEYLLDGGQAGRWEI